MVKKVSADADIFEFQETHAPQHDFHWLRSFVPIQVHYMSEVQTGQLEALCNQYRISLSRYIFVVAINVLVPGRVMHMLAGSTIG